MTAKNIGYWAATGLFALAMTGSGLVSVTGGMAEQMGALEYPAYFALILGTWKLLGVMALVVPGLPTLKEWAYAGFGFAMSGAAASHLLNGEPVFAAIPPLVLLGIAGVSYALRPTSRRHVADEVVSAAPAVARAA